MIVMTALAILAGAVAVSAQDNAQDGAPDIALEAAKPAARAVPLSLDGTRVEIPSGDGAPTLTGYLYRPRPDGPAATDAAPRPAVVLMHGCSGLINPRTGRFFALYQPWVRALNADGYVALVVDSAGSRGLGQTCSPPQAAGAMWRARPSDAYAALAYLAAQPSVRADRVALMGWSQGGGATLIALNARTSARTSPAGQAALARLPHDFRTAVAFYPGACSEAFQARTMPAGEAQGWTSQVPLLVLSGDADTWTQLPPCAAFLDAARARGNPVELKIYPGAVHAFDAPALPRTELPHYRTRDGRVPVIGTDVDARRDAFMRVRAWLKDKMQ
jgi:dienelactone hydrolase